MLREQSGIATWSAARYSAASSRSRSSSLDHAPTEARTSGVPGRLRTTTPRVARRSRVASGSSSSHATSVVWSRGATVQPAVREPLGELRGQRRPVREHGGEVGRAQHVERGER